MPDVASSLQNVLEYEGDVETDMYMTFQVGKLLPGKYEMCFLSDKCGRIWKD